MASRVFGLASNHGVLWLSVCDFRRGTDEAGGMAVAASPRLSNARRPRSTHLPIMPIILTIVRDEHMLSRCDFLQSSFEGATHGFETISSKRIPERQRRIGRRFVGSSRARRRS